MELKKIDWHDYKAIAEDTQRQGMGSTKMLGYISIGTKCIYHVMSHLGMI